MSQASAFKTLLPISSSQLEDEEVNTINARDLHELLEVRSQFSNWITTRLSDGFFREGKDFIITENPVKTETGSNKGRPRIDYHLTLDVAKHLAMLERNDRGREVREYFIEAEKVARKALPDFDDPVVAARAWADAKEESRKWELLAIEQTKYIEANKPKVTYHDIVLKCSNLLTITQISNDYPITPVKLNQILAEEGVQYKDRSGVWTIKAAYNAQNLAQTETYTYMFKGKRYAKLHLKWTQKGRLFIYDLLKTRGILPNVEQADYVAPPDAKELPYE